MNGGLLGIPARSVVGHFRKGKYPRGVTLSLPFGGPLLGTVPSPSERLDCVRGVFQVLLRFPCPVAFFVTLPIYKVPSFALSDTAIQDFSDFEFRVQLGWWRRLCRLSTNVSLDATFELGYVEVVMGS